MEMIDPYTRVCLEASTLGKYHMVITVAETKENYKEGMSEQDFIKNGLAFLGCVDVPPFIPDYLRVAYMYHAAGADLNTVYDRTDGRAFSELINGLSSRIKPGMTEIEFENHLVPGYPAGGGDMLKKPKWVNWIRKAIDFIDDNWK